ncbi:hypothetical protein SCUP515_10457 [Seiridium cupressi]
MSSFTLVVSTINLHDIVNAKVAQPVAPADSIHAATMAIAKVHPAEQAVSHYGRAEEANCTKDYIEVQWQPIVP